MYYKKSYRSINEITFYVNYGIVKSLTNRSRQNSSTVMDPSSSGSATTTKGVRLNTIKSENLFNHRLSK